ncbi:MAG: hypothetical protein ACJA0N_001521 [Pseudohongiellaceae bacterium]|jgi:hypothetical protein
MKPRILLFILVLACSLAHSQDPGATKEMAKEVPVEPTEEATDKTATTPPRSKFGNSFSTINDPQLLSKDLPSEQILWLDIAGKKVLSLYSPDHSGRAKGGVILLPRHDQPITIHNRLFNLQQTLADNSWHALTIVMPSFTDAENEANLAQQYIDAAIQFLNDKGIYNMVLLGEGINAHRMLQFANQLTTQKKAKQIRGLAIVNPVNSGIKPTIEALIPKLPFSILDIYFDEGLETKRNAKLRLRNSRSMPAKQYQQIRMLRLANNQKENRLTKRVRGWLDKTAAGFSVGVK